MSKNVPIPDELFAQAAELAEADGIPLEEYIAAALAEQLKWRRYSRTQADRDGARYAGVQERMPDSDFSDE